MRSFDQGLRQYGARRPNGLHGNVVGVKLKPETLPLATYRRNCLPTCSLRDGFFRCDDELNLQKASSCIRA
jgi:hypothetical protein